MKESIYRLILNILYLFILFISVFFLIIPITIRFFAFKNIMLKIAGIGGIIVFIALLILFAFLFITKKMKIIPQDISPEVFNIDKNKYKNLSLFLENQLKYDEYKTIYKEELNDKKISFNVRRKDYIIILNVKEINEDSLKFYEEKLSNNKKELRGLFNKFTVILLVEKETNDLWRVINNKNQRNLVAAVVQSKQKLFISTSVSLLNRFLFNYKSQRRKLLNIMKI